MCTYFVVQAYSRTRLGALAADAPIQAESGDHALRLASRLAVARAGVVAFSRRGDPATGDYEDAEILGYFGEVPPLERAFSAAC